VTIKNVKRGEVGSYDSFLAHTSFLRTSFGFEKPELNDLIFFRQFKGDRMANVSRMNETAKITIIVVAMVTSLSAGAGEKLRFRTGTVSTTKPVVRGYEGTFSSDARKPSRFFVVQFKSKIQKADQQAITAAGLKPRRYIPDDALLVEGSAEQV
jgi:hypothetical protein